MNSKFDIYFSDAAFTDINPLFVGTEQCDKNHSYGPRICPYTIIHYVLDGKGILECNDKQYSIEKGQFFIIFEGDTARYCADSEQPWQYIWIAYDGIYMNSLKKTEKNIFDCDSKAFEKLLELGCSGILDKYTTASVLYYLHGINLGNSDKVSSHNYPDEVKRIINLKYMQSISVMEIAKMLSIDKRYMSRIFKEKFGKTVVGYLIDTRMKHACKLLSDGYSVADVSTMVGYTDTFNFSKIFKKYIGISPSDYKKQHI